MSSSGLLGIFLLLKPPHTSLLSNKSDVPFHRRRVPEILHHRSVFACRLQSKELDRWKLVDLERGLCYPRLILAEDNDRFIVIDQELQPL